jgi:hypothetical protein
MVGSLILSVYNLRNVQSIRKHNLRAMGSKTISFQASSVQPVKVSQPFRYPPIAADELTSKPTSVQEYEP